jgi:drug/metabolite transporter (DMT)-like permease
VGYLLVVYVVWGSTYLAIRVAVREGAGFPPFTMAAMRTLLAAAVLLGAGRLLGQRLRLSQREAVVLAASGLLLWLGGNGLVVWAEQHADSGYAAVVVGSTPIWVATIEGLLDRQPPSWLLVVSLGLGLAGVAVLSGLSRTAQVDLSALAALLGAALTWSAGTVLQRRRPVEVAAAVSSGYQLLFGGLGFAGLVLLTGEPRPQPTPEAWLAWLYLVVFGSLIAFTAYVLVLRKLPGSIAMTYSYVNPVIAVLLGALLLAEPVTLATLLGVGLVLLGVGGVYRTRMA